jgi:hypothetical protein
LAAFDQAGHPIEPRSLSQEKHTMERLVKPVAWGEIPLQRNDARESAQHARRSDALGYEVFADGVKDRMDPHPGVSSSATSKTSSEA